MGPLTVLTLAAFSACMVRAELPLPANLVELRSTQGKQLLMEATLKDDFFLLGQHFVTQINGAFCGPASSAVVLNALGVPRPLQSPESRLNGTDYAYYDQVNIFDNKTEEAIPQATVKMQGLTLDELSDFLAAHTAVASCHYRSQLPAANVELFRAMLLKALSLPGMFAIVNFDRSVLLERGSGHHSPVAAYHQSTDSVLVLDVSRYKYAAWWAPVTELFASTSRTVDSGTKLPRGLVFAWATNMYPGQDICPAHMAASTQDAASIMATPTTDNGYPVQSTGNAGLVTRIEIQKMGLSSGGAAGLAVAMLFSGTAIGLLVALVWHKTTHQSFMASVSGIVKRSSGSVDKGAPASPDELTRLTAKDSRLSDTV